MSGAGPEYDKTDLAIPLSLHIPEIQVSNFKLCHPNAAAVEAAVSILSWQCLKMIFFYIFLILLSNCLAFAQEEKGHADEDSSFVDQILREEQCFNNTDLEKIMSDILDKMMIMEECLLGRKEKIADIESISACTASVRESIKEVQDFVNQEQEIHLEINNPGKRQSQ